MARGFLFSQGIRVFFSQEIRGLKMRVFADEVRAWNPRTLVKESAAFFFLCKDD